MSDIETRIAKLPVWRQLVALEPLVGGLSNLSFTATDDTGKYVVRITRDFPFHHVYRDREVMTARAAHAAGFAPEVIHAEPGLMVSRYIEGRVYGPADIKNAIPRITELIARFHRDMPARVEGAGFIFWPAHVNRDYIRMLDGHIAAPELSRWLDINGRLEAAQMPLPIIFGHHDLRICRLRHGDVRPRQPLLQLRLQRRAVEVDAGNLARRPAHRRDPPQSRGHAMRLAAARDAVVARLCTAPARAGRRLRRLCGRQPHTLRSGALRLSLALRLRLRRQTGSR